MNTPDICRNRHRGNSESEQANEDNARTREKQRTRVLNFLRSKRAGATVDEAAMHFGCTPNALSGRFTELKAMGLIEKIGKRPTRTGSIAGVYRPPPEQTELFR